MSLSQVKLNISWLKISSLANGLELELMSGHAYFSCLRDGSGCCGDVHGIGPGIMTNSYSPACIVLNVGSALGPQV